jgi:hypothetical protein
MDEEQEVYEDELNELNELQRDNEQEDQDEYWEDE